MSLSPWVPIAVGVASLTTGIVAATWGLVERRHATTWPVAEARVVRLVPDAEGDPWPVLAYRGTDGANHEVEPRQKRAEWQVGTMVRVRVDPSDPTKAEPADLRNPLPYLLAFSAVMEAVIAAGLWYFGSRL